MDIEKFKNLCKAVEGYVGVVEQGQEIAIATTQADCGESGLAASVDPIRRFMKECGMVGGVMPFPYNGKLIYYVKFRAAA